MKRLNLVFSMLFISFVFLSSVTFLLVRHLSTAELAKKLDTGLIESDLGEKIRQLVSDADTGVSLTGSLKNDISPSEPVISDYELAVRHMRSGNTELAVSYFERIIETRQVMGGTGVKRDPYLYSRIFLNRILWEQFERRSPELVSEIIVGFADGHLDPIIAQALFEDSAHSFSTQEVSVISSAIHFHKASLQEMIPDNSIRHAQVFFSESGDNTFTYIIHPGKKALVTCADQKQLKQGFAELASKYSDFKVRLSLDAGKEGYKDISGIAVMITPDTELASKAQKGIIVRYYSVFFFLIIIYALISFSVARYILMLKKVEMMKDSFLNIISHELKTPLSGIKLYADTLAGLDSDEKTKEYAEIISAKSMQIKNIIANLLYFNKLSDFKQIKKLKDSIKEKFEEIELHPLVSAICHDYSRSYLKECKLDFPDKAFKVRSDRSILNIIISNIIDNSFKYSGQETIEIRIRTFQDSDCARISLSDNGNLPKDFDTQSVFEKYRRKDDSGKSGLGLGLFIVKELTALVNGTVCAENSGSLEIKITLKGE